MSMRRLAVLVATAPWFFGAVSAQQASSQSGKPPPAPPVPVKGPEPTPPVQASTGEVAEEKRRLAAEKDGQEFYMAAGRGDLAAVKSYLTAGVPIDYVAPSTGLTALAHASTMHAGDVEAVVEHLLKQRADPDIQDPRGRTALFFAVADLASDECVKELVKYAKNLDPHDTHGVTALNVATRKGNIPAMKVLMAAGADPHRGDSFGGSAYHEAEVSRNNDVRKLFNLSTIQVNAPGAGEL